MDKTNRGTKTYPLLTQPFVRFFADYYDPNLSSEASLRISNMPGEENANEKVHAGVDNSPRSR